jgi:site-specific DNA-methyltransferase (adenine-specific)
MLTPYYEEDGITIYLGDSRKILPQMPSVSAIITDPPYGIGWARGTWTENPAEYPGFIRWLVACCNKLVPNGWVFIFQAMPNTGHFSEWFPEGFRLYAACKNFAQTRPTGICHAWDPVVFWKNGIVIRNADATNRDYHVGNVAGVFRDGNDHPCPKPLDTMQHIVSIASLQDMRILDPFMGSGTTLVAAKMLGREAIGIEISQTYCDIAIERLRQGVLAFPPELSTQEVLTFDDSWAHSATQWPSARSRG